MRDENGRFIGKIEPEIVEKRNTTRKLNGWHSESSKKNISEGQKRNLELIEQRRKIAKKMGSEHGGKHTTNQSREKNKIDTQQRWNNPNYKNKVIQKMMWKNGTSKPNTKELLLQHLLPDEWKFVGNGEVVLGGRCPDFINTNGKKQIIELFGSYWHSYKKIGRGKQEEEDLRKSHFSKYGYQTLVIWESELKNPTKIIEKVTSFSDGGEKQ